jgi:hypothetical protein
MHGHSAAGSTQHSGGFFGVISQHLGVLGEELADAFYVVGNGTDRSSAQPTGNAAEMPAAFP